MRKSRESVLSECARNNSASACAAGNSERPARLIMPIVLVLTGLTSGLKASPGFYGGQASAGIGVTPSPASTSASSVGRFVT